MKALIAPDKITPELLAALKEVGGIDDLVQELSQTKEASRTNLNKALDQFITQYEDMIEVKKEAAKLSEEDDEVLILGETGTGKELIARILHGNRSGPFIPINCGAIPDSLIESELFGHKKGTFTGSIADKKGLFEEAEDGTLFLDEIAELPYMMQVKLLRVIQEKKIRRLGDAQERCLSCRVICATHRNLQDWILMEKFREDLYYRLSTFILELSPLERRSKDIPLIVKHLDKENRIKNLETFCGLIDTSKLKGNVRSLQQIVRRYYVLGKMPNE